MSSSWGGGRIENNDIVSSVRKFLTDNLKVDFVQAEIKSAYKRGGTFNKTKKVPGSRSLPRLL